MQLDLELPNNDLKIWIWIIFFQQTHLGVIGSISTNPFTCLVFINNANGYPILDYLEVSTHKKLGLEFVFGPNS